MYFSTFRTSNRNISAPSSPVLNIFKWVFGIRSFHYIITVSINIIWDFLHIWNSPLRLRTCVFALSVYSYFTSGHMLNYYNLTNTVSIQTSTCIPFFISHWFYMFLFSETTRRFNVFFQIQQYHMWSLCMNLPLMSLIHFICLTNDHLWNYLQNC